MLILLSCYLYKFHVKNWLIKAGLVKQQPETEFALQAIDNNRNLHPYLFEVSTMCN